jgi:hypothetical protein
MADAHTDEYFSSTEEVLDELGLGARVVVTGRAGDPVWGTIAMKEWYKGSLLPTIVLDNGDWISLEYAIEAEELLVCPL